MAQDKKRNDKNETKDSEKIFNDQLGENANEKLESHYDNKGSDPSKKKI